MDTINVVKDLGYEVVTWIQTLAIPAASIAFGIGGLNHIFGGKNGIDKAKGWYIGGAAGLVVALAAKSFAEFLQGKINF